MKVTLAFLIFLSLSILAFNVWMWHSLFKEKAATPQVTPSSPTALPTITRTITPIETPIPTATLSPAPTIDETSLIKQAVYRRTSLDESRAEITISYNSGRHAKGNIKEFTAVGGAYWLAAKTDTGWLCIYDGQSHPTCAQIAPYDFPISLVPECLDATGNVISR